MPDLPADVRAKKEAALATIMRRALRADKKRLVAAMGNPPDVANIPPELWDKVRANIARRTRAALALLFLMGSDNLRNQLKDDIGDEDWDIDPERAGDKADKYAERQSKRLARQSARTLRTRLRVAARDLRAEIRAMQAEARALGIPERPPPRGPDETLPAYRSRLGLEAGTEIPRIPTRADVRANLGRVVDATSEVQAEAAGITEVTSSTVAGERYVANEVERGGGRMTAFWRTEADERVCQICFPMDWVPEDNWPEELETGPPAHVNCILPGNEVVPLGQLEATAKSFYDGPCVEICFKDGGRISVTPNHPILTPGGWVPAYALQVGFNVVGATNPERMAATINPNNDNVPAVIEQVLASFRMSGGVASAVVPASPVNFHGDGMRVQGNVDIVYARRFLGRTRNPHVFQHTHQKNFGGSLVGNFAFANGRSQFPFSNWHFPAPTGVVGGFGLPSAGLGVHSRPFHSFGLGLIAGGNPSVNQIRCNDPSAHSILLGQPKYGRSGKVLGGHLGNGFGAFGFAGLDIVPNMDARFSKSFSQNARADAELACQFLQRFARDITTRQIVKIRNFQFSGHVYDLQVGGVGGYPLYTCNGVVVHNCRCWVEYHLVRPPGATGRDLDDDEADPVTAPGVEPTGKERVGWVSGGYGELGGWGAGGSKRRSNPTGVAKAFDESKVVRDHGKFAEKGGGGGPATQQPKTPPPKPPANQKELLSKVSREANNRDLNDAMRELKGTALYDVLDEARVPHQVLDMFEGHGTSTLSTLTTLLNGGVDKDREFYTETLSSQKPGRLLRDNSSFVVLSHPGQSIKDGGIPAVVVDKLHEPNIPELKAAFPGVKFFPAHKMPEILGKVTGLGSKRRTLRRLWVKKCGGPGSGVPGPCPENKAEAPAEAKPRPTPFELGKSKEWFTKRERQELLRQHGYDPGKDTQEFNRGQSELSAARAVDLKVREKAFVAPYLEQAKHDLGSNATEDEIYETAKAYAETDQEEREKEEAKARKEEEEVAKIKADEEARKDPQQTAEMLQVFADNARNELTFMNPSRSERQAMRAQIQAPAAHEAAQAAGWKFEYMSLSGSMYYNRGEERLRIADHEVPETEERRHNVGQGGFSWAGAGNQIILPVDDFDEQLAEISNRRATKSIRCITPDDAFAKWGAGRFGGVAKCGGKGGKPGPCPSGIQEQHITPPVIPVLDAVTSHVADSSKVTPEEKRVLTEAATGSKTRKPQLQRVFSVRPDWTKGQIVDLPATSFTGVDVASGKNAGHIGWKDYDKAVARIDKPTRGLDVDYSKLGDKAGLVSPSEENETIVAGKYRVDRILKIPVPGTREDSGWDFIPQYVLVEV